MKKVSVVLALLTPTPFLRAMTEFTIKTLRYHADNKFELVVVEAAHNYFESPDEVGVKADKYLNFTPKIGCVRELNKGLEAASGEFVVCTGNDVIVPPHWDTELLRCFEERKDCGVASLSAFEPGAIIGPPHALDRIVEGMYSPFVMFRAGERMDEDYIKIYQDSDFVMRVYERGQRAYRSCRAHVHHLLRMTSDRVDNAGHNRDLAHDERLFYQRWGKSPLAMFGMIRSSHQIYGREHEAFVNPINLHYDPSKPE
ncbi:MAG: glycosyltransferase family A protein [Candidatus Binatia bacterium]|nr:glycosyltransferase family A protein [Candidatus Binatia bacterium]